MPKKKRRNSDPGTSKPGKTDSTAKARPHSQSTAKTSAPKERKSWLTISKLPSNTTSPNDSRARSDSRDTLRLSGDRPTRFTPPKDRIPRSDDQFTDDVDTENGSTQYNITAITADLQDLTDQGATRDDLLDYLHDSVEMSREYAETYLTQYWDDDPSGGRSPQKKSPKLQSNIDGTDSDGTNSDESDNDESNSEDNADEDSTPVNAATKPSPKIKIDLNKLTNPTVIREATKLAARVEKFQTGLDLAKLNGVRILGDMDVETELQKIFELADTHNDPQLLTQLLNATSFNGKLSLFQPTTESGRAQVRITQLFNAIQGDGSYAKIRDNINALATEAPVLRQMARDVKLLSSLDNALYVDSTRLLRPIGEAPVPISETTREWHLEQASLMKAYRDIGTKDPALQKKLALAMLQSFAKAAPVGAAKAEELGVQVSPILNAAGFYHRSIADNPLLDKVVDAYCQDMGLVRGRVHLVDNPTFREVLAREYGMEGVNTKISTPSDYTQALQALFDQADQGRFPSHKIVLDITELFKQANLQPSQISDGMVKDLEKTFLEEAEKFLNTHSGVDKSLFKGMMTKLQIGAMTTYKGMDVLLTPPFLSQRSEAGASPLQDDLIQTAKTKGLPVRAEFLSDLNHSMIHSGYRLDPIQARKAWLEVADPSTILKEYKIQLTELATSDKPTPEVFASFKDFINHASFKQFENLGQVKNAPPYLTIMTKVTANMLRGLAQYNDSKGGVDRAMQDQGLDEVLQMAYYRMLNALAGAVQKQDDLMGFLNQVEVIQQQIATLVSLVEPYGQDDFGTSIRDRLTNAATGPGGKPVIPPGLDTPGIQLKPSAMHCLASILSSAEALKGDNDLNVCVIKDHYYESAGAIDTAKAAGTYSVSEFDGDAVRDPSGLGTKPLDPTSLKGKKPLDLYVCDFHHNISLGRNHYRIEDLQHHVDELYSNDLVADKFTVAIDCTIDFVNSKDVQAFLEHNKARIESGALNVVLFRSAQKFDMVGMDNYYGGFTVNINDHATFRDFNTRMEAPEDQLKGPSRQGLSHIAVHASQDTDEYRNALMVNTKRFYDALPKDLIWSPGTTSAMQVAKTDDPNAVFLDIKFPGNPQAEDAFMDRFKQFATDEALPMTGRASFGFITSNLNQIKGEKIRLTPGLEGPELQDRYIAFFKAVHKQANQAVKAGTKKGLTGVELNKFIAEKIKTMPMK